MEKSRMAIGEHIKFKANFDDVFTSVADPDPEDPYVLGPLGSGSFYHQAKKVRKTLIPSVLSLL